MPYTMESVIVFGDSLSDIGRKWTTKAGRAALIFKEMFVSPNGRFSDCRNWTDFMIEDAGARSLVVGSAQSTIDRSKRHMNFTNRSQITPDDDTFPSFYYANYADGGACGDTPASKKPFLRTFKDQVDWFENDVAETNQDLGNTLFIIWFGANDLYTAERKAADMHLVAGEVAKTQRDRLEKIVKKKGFKPWFVFVNLGHPLSSVFYSRKLEAAEAAVRADLRGAQAAGPPGGRLIEARRTLVQASRTIEPGWIGKGKKLKALKEEVAIVENLETGVRNYNVSLLAQAKTNGDAVVKVAQAISENTLRLLVGNGTMAAGAMEQQAVQVGAAIYGQLGGPQPLTTIDQKHPTDQMYRFLWEEIYAELQLAGLSFGRLSAAAVGQALRTAARSGMREVMAELAQRGSH